MANNVTANAGAGGANFATDDVAGVHYPVTKIAFGADDTANWVTSISVNPFPVALSDTDNAVLDNINAALAGTLTVGAHAVTNAGTFAVQESGAALTALQLIDDPVATIGTTPLMRVAIFNAADSQITTFPVSNADLTTLAAVDYATQTTLAALNAKFVTGTVIGDVNLGAVDNAVLDAIAASDASIDGKITACNTGAVVLAAGTAAFGKLAANSGVDIGDVDVTSIAAGSNLIGDVGLSGARTSGGATPYYNAGTATETQIKATAGQIYFISAVNVSASVRYLQLFNATAASVTPGTTTPTNEWPIPTQGDTNGAGFMLPIPNGLAYGTAITFFISTTKGGGTAATANDVLLNIGYA